jgi:hypothetical protein
VEHRCRASSIDGASMLFAAARGYAAAALMVAAAPRYAAAVLVAALLTF